MFTELNFQVKIKNWVDGKEHEDIIGLSARFGASLPTKAHDHLRQTAVFSNPRNCCSDSSSEVFFCFRDGFFASTMQLLRILGCVNNIFCIFS